jgi:pyrroloquinoline quinone biosynthesis protein B
VRIKILGSGAGGGFPQWNCNNPLSRAVRQGQPGFLPRTQSSLAASADDRNWLLFNASPDIRAQIAAHRELQPAPDGPLRASPIKAVFLTNADVDHVAGLLTLRERQPFLLYATGRVLQALAGNSIFGVLASDVVRRVEVAPASVTDIEGPDGEPLGITVESFPVHGKIALYLEQGGAENGFFGTEEGDAVGVSFRASGKGGGAPAGAKRAVYAPGCSKVDDALLARVDGADCLFFDGTTFTNTEMIEAGVGDKTAARMGHIHVSGPEGSMAAFAGATVGRRIFVHINNTNPILQQGSAAEDLVKASGWEVGADGMEIVL